MRFSIAFILALFWIGNLSAQHDPVKKHKIDSLTAKLKADSLRTFRFKKLRPYANIDNRNSFIRNHPANISGLQLGVIVNEYHTFGFGSYKLNQASQKDAPIKNGYRMNYLRYFTVFYEYVLLSHRYIEIDLPFELGVGNYNANIVDTLDMKKDRTISPGFVPLGSGVKINLKPVPWIGVTFMGGYRQVLERKINLDLSGIYYSFGIWLDLRQVYRDIKFYGFQKKKYKKAVHHILMN
jgi:hypothetical protein